MSVPSTSRAAASSSPTRSPPPGSSVAGRRALDVGASTGGFTDCLLQRGADSVIALDVGYGTLDYRLRVDPRVVVMERTNARALEPGSAARRRRPPGPRDDRRLVHLAAQGARRGARVPRARLRRARARQAAVRGRSRQGRQGRRRARLRRCGARRSSRSDRAPRALGATVLGYISSGLPGPKGNRETFVWLADPARGHATPPDADALERMAREVEP